MLKSKQSFIKLLILLFVFGMFLPALPAKAYLVSNVRLTNWDTNNHQITWDWNPNGNPNGTVFRVRQVRDDGSGGEILEHTDTTTEHSITFSTNVCKVGHKLYVAPCVKLSNGNYECDSDQVGDDEVPSAWEATVPCVPQQPEYVTVEAGSIGKMTVKWKGNEDTPYFKVYRYKGGVESTVDKEFTVDTILAPENEYTWVDDDGIENNVSYKYGVKSYWSVYTGDNHYQNYYSSEKTSDSFVYSRIDNVASVTCPEQTVTGLTVTVNNLANLSEGNSGVELISVKDEDGNITNLPFATNYPNYQQSTDFTINGLSVDTSYSFQFISRNADEVTNTKTGWITDSSCSTNTVGSVPAPPTNLTFNNVTKTQIGLEWTDNSNNESGFKIYRDTATTWKYTNSADDTTWTDTDHGHDLDCGTSYTYWVSAYNDYGESAKVSAKPQP